MRARNIKPGFYANEDLAECSPWARLIFPGLWMLADREGRLEDRPKRIKAQLLPFDSQEVSPLLDELQSQGFIHRYSVDSGNFIQIIAFDKHQTPHYSEKKSIIKPPPAQDDSANSGGLISPQSPEVSEKPSPSRPPDSKSDPENSESNVPIKRVSQPPDSLNPDSLNPDSLNPDSGVTPLRFVTPLAARSAKPPKPPATNGATVAVWAAYAEAYRGRYGVDPVRNAKVNGAVANLCKRIPQDEAPAVAAWYVGHRAQRYVAAGHAVTLLVLDAEKLRTEWATGRQMTSTQARQSDRTGSIGNTVAEYIAGLGSEAAHGTR